MQKRHSLSELRHEPYRSRKSSDSSIRSSTSRRSSYSSSTSGYCDYNLFPDQSALFGDLDFQLGEVCAVTETAPTNGSKTVQDQLALDKQMRRLEYNRNEKIYRNEIATCYKQLAILLPPTRLHYPVHDGISQLPIDLRQGLDWYTNDQDGQIQPQNINESGNKLTKTQILAKAVEYVQWLQLQIQLQQQEDQLTPAIVSQYQFPSNIITDKSPARLKTIDSEVDPVDYIKSVDSLIYE
ncbi:hypothetical protein MIR68_010038 [Amoeboaphelidium protococcarum]|nr:hypothetical protein MIR68_010038 [Amoeboaphelidium protococcarum]